MGTDHFYIFEEINFNRVIKVVDILYNYETLFKFLISRHIFRVNYLI